MSVCRERSVQRRWRRSGRASRKWVSKNVCVCVCVESAKVADIHQRRMTFYIWSGSKQLTDTCSHIGLLRDCMCAHLIDRCWGKMGREMKPLIHPQLSYCWGQRISGSCALQGCLGVPNKKGNHFSFTIIPSISKKMPECNKTFKQKNIIRWGTHILRDCSLPMWKCLRAPYVHTLNFHIWNICTYKNLSYI